MQSYNYIKRGINLYSGGIKIVHTLAFIRTGELAQLFHSLSFAMI